MSILYKKVGIGDQNCGTLEIKIIYFLEISNGGLLMKNYIGKIKNMERKDVLFMGTVLFSTMVIIVFLNCYFSSYKQPYMMNEIIDMSEDWEYRISGGELKELETLRTGPKIKEFETVTIYKKLDKKIEEAAILIRENHQVVNVYLDETPLYIDRKIKPDQNPGMSLQFILLPDNYLNKTLQIEITSPYKLYAGRTSPILMGTIPSLEAYTLSKSMRSLILMAMCIFMGFSIIMLTFIQSTKGSSQPQHLAIGIFAIIWALYYICTEYIVFQFFSPFWVSTISLSLYFTFQVPLMLYFYFSFHYYKTKLFPALVFHTAFAILAIILQVTGILDLPRLININNVLLAGLIYTIILSILEAIKGNRYMILSSPFFVVAYVSMLYNFYVFYSRRGVVPYTYKDTYFLLLLCILISNVWIFFRRYYFGIQESKLLRLQSRLAKESYDQIRVHLHEVGSLKHEMKNHIAALQIYLSDGRYEEAGLYLDRIAEKSVYITDTVYHDHFLINAVVSRMLKIAKSENINIELNLKSGPLKILDNDLHSLLTNIIDNAVEACRAIPEGIKRFICLTISRKDPYLIIICTNSYNGEIIFEDGSIKTLKKESEHGYGIWTINKIAESYDGIVDIDFDQSVFTITAAIKD